MTKDRERSVFECEFATKRPWVYHLTAAMNIARIGRMGRLQCATTLMEAGGCSRPVRERRRKSLVVHVLGEDVHVRDQIPLSRNNMCLPRDCSFEDWVAHLNGLVFFWPGRACGPTESGLGHFRRYAAERPALVRIPTADLFRANSGASPRFSHYNSGAPRQYRGRRSPRGPDTFAFGHKFAGTVRGVVEVVYRTEARLPATAEFGYLPQGPWQPFRRSA